MPDIELWVCNQCGMVLSIGNAWIKHHKSVITVIRNETYVHLDTCRSCQELREQVQGLKREDFFNTYKEKE